MEKSVPAEMKPPSSVFLDPGRNLRQARRLVVAAVALPLFFGLMMAVDGILRARRQDDAAIHWMQRLDLSSPAFWPAGTPQRRPSALPPCIDLRMSPFGACPGDYRPRSRPGPGGPPP